MVNACISILLKRITPWLPNRVVKDRTDGGVYLVRYYLLRAFTFELALHHILRADSEERLHNHPWRWAVSLILFGGYIEERLESDTRVAARSFIAGQVNTIGANTFHRVSQLLTEEVWTLFAHGSRNKDWGFIDQPDGERAV
jgi:hypothetical protein